MTSQKNLGCWFGACLAVAIALCACKRDITPSQPTSAVARPVEKQTHAPLRPEEQVMWDRSGTLDAVDLARLAEWEGSAGLVSYAESRRKDTAVLRSAVLSLAFTNDFLALPWLVRVASSDEDAIARDAIQTIETLASERRRQVDPEDAEELREGCDRLSALAADLTKPLERREGAALALHMLRERGCAHVKVIQGN